VTGRVAEKMLPVMKTALEVAAMEATAILPLPAKVRKTGLRLESNLATKELVEVPVGVGNAALAVAASVPEVVVPVT
jgi:hypothetical protein